MSKTTIPKNRSSAKTGKSFFVSVFLGTLIALAIGLGLLIVSSFAGLSLEDPEPFLPIISLVSLFVSSLFGGYLSARIHKESGLVCGALSGILLIGILVLLTFSCSFSIKLSLFMICAPAILVVASIAGVCGVNGGKEKKTKRKKGF